MYRQIDVENEVRKHGTEILEINKRVKKLEENPQKRNKHIGIGVYLTFIIIIVFVFSCGCGALIAIGKGVSAALGIGYGLVPVASVSVIGTLMFLDSKIQDGKRED